MGFGDTSKKANAAARAAGAAAQAQADAEAASWKDTDKGVNAKAARASDKQAAADAKLAAKKELKELEAAEEAQSAPKPKKAASKLTQAQIAQKAALMAAAGKAKAKPKTVAQPKLEANLNKEVDVIEASGIDGALAVLEVDESKGKKMTWKEFEELQTPGVKADNPGLKGSQVKDHVRKMWDRAPENPKNQ